MSINMAQTIKEEFGIEYPDKEAWEAAHNFYNLFHLLYKMDQKQNPKNYKKVENK
jgi:hypothetical protein